MNQIVSLAKYYVAFAKAIQVLNSDIYMKYKVFYGECKEFLLIILIV